MTLPSGAARLVALAVPAFFFTGAAWAADKGACTGAADKGQDLRDAHKLIEAREEFRACAAATCPAPVQADCISWLGSLEKAIPTVVVTAKSADGAAIVDATLSVDGRPFADTLSGQALAINPGPHTFHVEAMDGASHDELVVVAEGEQAQRVAVVLRRARAEPPPVQPTPAPAPGGPPAQRVLAAVAWGVGLVGLGVGTAFGVAALSTRSAANGLCSGATCPTAEGSQKWNDAAAAGNASTVALIAGGAVLAAGTILWFTAPAAQGTQVGVSPGGVALKGTW